MTDAFTDIIEDDEGGSESEEVETSQGENSITSDSLDESDTVGPEDVITDMGVKTTLPDGSEINDTTRYSDPDSDKEADDVDPRKLFGHADINEIRYYARENPYGKTIVRKPIDDVFKHGFEVKGDGTERGDGTSKIQDFLEAYEPYYKLAEKHARTDGLALLLFQIADKHESAAKPIHSDGGEHRGFKLYTLDNLSDSMETYTVAEHTKYDQDDIYVTQGDEHGGIAIVDNIGHPDNGKVVGYGIEPRHEREDNTSASFVHAERVQPFTWGEWVEGDLGTDVSGQIVGESVLTSVLQPIKATQMGYWAMKNILFRYSAPLHAVEPPESWSMDDFQEAKKKMGNISMASDAVFPPGATLSVAEGVSEFDPSPVYDTIVESICAGTVFTKSVLQGTQTGTVSGSETDVKGYFSEIELLRTERVEKKFREAVKMVNGYDKTTIPNVAGPNKFEIEWGPLFKVSDMKRMEGAISLMTAVTSGIKQYVLTPEEARSIVEEEWASFDIEVDLEELTEEDRDALDRINLHEAGQGTVGENEPDIRHNPQIQNGGGQPQGQTRESDQPVRDSALDLSELSDEQLREELERRADGN